MKLKTGLAFYLSVLATCQALPNFPDQYKLSGVLVVPSAGIEETFTVFYDGIGNRSKVNHYFGLTESLILANDGSYGLAQNFFYISKDNKKNIRSCSTHNGTTAHPLKPQKMIPDTHLFKYHGETPCLDTKLHRHHCHLWKKIVQKEGTTAFFYLTTMKKEGPYDIPVRYELHTHSDKYHFIYSDFVPGLVPEEEFKLKNSSSCKDYKFSSEEDTILFDPMNEYIHNNHKMTNSAFEGFKAKHSIKYTDKDEHVTRKKIFRDNFRFVHSTNRRGLTYTLAINHFADKTEEELRVMKGILKMPKVNNGDPFEDTMNEKDLPENFDWRDYGAVTRVKNQFSCGSCWSFAATGVLEGAHFLKTKKLISLSEQQLMDCSWGEHNEACNGGFDTYAYEYIKRNGGLQSEETYGPYLADSGKCHSNSSLSVVQVKSYVNVTKGDPQALKIAIYKNGPIFIGMDASLKTFSFYSNGVYSDTACKKKYNELDHAVLAVGYGVIDDEPYWLIKNSWSPYWGNDGYFFISQRNNTCGIVTSPSFPILK